MPEVAAMEQVRELLFEIKGEVGEIRGAQDGMLRQFDRLAGQLEQHVSDDRAAHADQDGRTLREFSRITERVGAMDARLAGVEHKQSTEAGGKQAGQRWAEWSWRALTAAGAIIGSQALSFFWTGKHP